MPSPHDRPLPPRLDTVEHAFATEHLVAKDFAVRKASSETFKLSDGTRAYALKVMDPKQNDLVVAITTGERLEISALRTGASIAQPIFPVGLDRLWVPITQNDGTQAPAQLNLWTPGRPITYGSRPGTPLMRNLGILIGSLHRAAISGQAIPEQESSADGSLDYFDMALRHPTDKIPRIDSNTAKTVFRMLSKADRFERSGRVAITHADLLDNIITNRSKPTLIDFLSADAANLDFETLQYLHDISGPKTQPVRIRAFFEGYFEGYGRTYNFRRAIAVYDSLLVIDALSLSVGDNRRDKRARENDVLAKAANPTSLFQPTTQLLQAGFNLAVNRSVAD